MIWDFIIHNVNAMSNRGWLNMCGYKTYWVHQGWGETNIGITFNIMKNTGVSKGGKILLVTDADHVLPRAYMYWNKMHTHPYNFNA